MNQQTKAPERIEMNAGWRFELLTGNKTPLYKLMSGDDYFHGIWNLKDAQALAAAAMQSPAPTAPVVRSAEVKDAIDELTKAISGNHASSWAHYLSVKALLAYIPQLEAQAGGQAVQPSLNLAQALKVIADLENQVAELKARQPAPLVRQSDEDVAREIVERCTNEGEAWTFDHKRAAALIAAHRKADGEALRQAILLMLDCGLVICTNDEREFRVSAKHTDKLRDILAALSQPAKGEL